MSAPNERADLEALKRPRLGGKDPTWLSHQPSLDSEKNDEPRGPASAARLERDLLWRDLEYYPYSAGLYQIAAFISSAIEIARAITD
jgi:hypothetical protein